GRTGGPSVPRRVAGDLGRRRAGDSRRRRRRGILRRPAGSAGRHRDPDAVTRGVRGLPAARRQPCAGQPSAVHRGRCTPPARPAYVRTKVDGHWHLPFLTSDDPADDERKIAASKEHLDKLALVHTTDWRALGFDRIGTVPASEKHCATTVLDDIETWLATFQF